VCVCVCVCARARALAHSLSTYKLYYMFLFVYIVTSYVLKHFLLCAYKYIIFIHIRICIFRSICTYHVCIYLCILESIFWLIFFYASLHPENPKYHSSKRRADLSSIHRNSFYREAICPEEQQ